MGILNFALIGCGKVANKHAISIQRIEKANLVAACDIDKERAKKFGNKYRINSYSSIEEMVNEENIDVASILTPSGTHSEIAIKVANLKKHIVVEKPMALRLEDADRMISACDENGVKLFVVKQNRFNLPIIKLKEAIDKGRFGKLVLGTIRVRWCRTQNYYNEVNWRGTWAEDGGVLTNQASHHIDMLQWLFGDIESVMTKTSTRLVNIETEDTGIAILKFYNGALGIIEATTATRPKDLEGSISILGENGSVEVGGFYMNELKTWNFNNESLEDKEIFSTHSRNPDAFAWNHTQFLKDVVESIKKGKTGITNGLEGRKSIELINALYESSETGKEVFLKFKPRKSKLGIKK